MRFLTAAAALALMLAPALSGPAHAAGKKSFLIVPGKSFGPITAKSTLAQLIRVYGRKNVRVGMLQPPHGDFPKQRGAVIYPNTPREVEVYFRERTNRVERVVVSRNNSVWRTKKGLRVGATLPELEKIFGGPFLISSYGRDGGGSIIAEGKRMQAVRDLYIRLSYPEKMSKADAAVTSSGKPFASNSAAARRLGLKVTVIWWDVGR